MISFFTNIFSHKKVLVSIPIDKHS